MQTVMDVLCVVMVVCNRFSGDAIVQNVYVRELCSRLRAISHVHTKSG